MTTALQVFDPGERNYHDPGDHDESTFSFLNRSARPAIEKIRIEIERWFARYSVDGQAELQVRFRTDDFNAAFLELYLHELFSRLGAVVQLHPSLGTKGKNPDFAVRIPTSNHIMVVEATVSYDVDQQQSGSLRRKNRILDAINAISSRFYFLAVSEF